MLLTWFGRDPEFEERHDEWERGGKQGREPDKYHFVKGFSLADGPPRGGADSFAMETP